MSSRPAIAAFVILSLAGCQKTANLPPPRYAFLRFENLSGDPSLDWTGRAASEVLSRELAGAMDGPVVPPRAILRFGPTLGSRPPAVPGDSTERTAAMLSGASRIVTGYITRSGGKLSITATEEDTSTGKTLASQKADGATPLEAFANLAHQFSNNAHEYLTPNNDALRAYCVAMESPLAQAAPGFEKAVQLDPKLGPAWVSLVALLESRGDKAGAQQVLAKGAAVSLDPLDRASLELEAANLQGDRKLRLEALRKIIANSPGDSALQRALADQETAAGNDREAAALWKKLADDNPADVEAWNNLAYALAYSGDSQGALAAIQHYVALRPNEANPLDSRGDIQYLFRDFKGAAASYSQAAAAQPDALNGGEVYKAAWARFKAGDLPGADAAFAQFRANQEKRKSESLPLLEADWLYRTGRKAQVFESLGKTIASTNGPLKSLLAAQLAVWYVMEGSREKAYRTITSVPLLRDANVASAFFLSRPSGPVSEWKALADRMFPMPAAGALHDMALAYALMLDQHKDAALPIWKQLMERETAVDYFSRAVASRLEGKPVQKPLLPNPLQYNQFAAIVDVL